MATTVVSGRIDAAEAALCRVAGQDEDVVGQALTCEEKNLEDGLILCAARAAGCGIIVTRDEKSFLGFKGHRVDERACLALLAASEGQD